MKHVDFRTFSQAIIGTFLSKSQIRLKNITDQTAGKFFCTFLLNLEFVLEGENKTPLSETFIIIGWKPHKILFVVFKTGKSKGGD